MELLQAFLPTRSAMLSDFFADVVGVCLAIMLFGVGMVIKKKLCNERISVKTGFVDY